VAECGQSVKFSQFLAYVVATLYDQDSHVKPISVDCSPCYVDYDIIGHMDTLVDDVMHLTSRLRLNNATLKAVPWEDAQATDTMTEAVQNVFQRWTADLNACVTNEEAFRRLWYALEVKGIISHDVQPPPTEQVSLEEVGQVSNVLHAAWQHSKHHAAALRQQRDAAMTEAYKQVHSSLKDSIRKLYAADFEMFGFDLRRDL
jgi:hypothetical protein